MSRWRGSLAILLGALAVVKYIHNKLEYNIEIDGSSLSMGPLNSGRDAAFETRIKDVLDTIVARKVGQQVLGHLPKDKKVTILPRTTPGGVFVPSSDICNALAEAPQSEDRKRGRILIDPATWKPQGECNPSGSAASDVDEVLLHEILHEYRQLSGHTHGDAFNVVPDKQYDTIEEFWAIVVTNIYLSEKGKTLLRKDHQNFAPLPPKWSTSVGFLGDPDLLRWTRIILSQEETLLKAIDTSISASTRFNPFHELLTDPKKYEVRDAIHDLVQDTRQPGPTP